MPKKIAIIPARSGSKGLINKNILMLIDRPLIAYTIEAAKRSELFEHVIVSTDSYEYKAIAEYYGAEVVMRGEDLSSDAATSFMVVEDILNKYNNFDYFVLLQPTSPFRSAEHISEAVNLFETATHAKFLASVVESSKSIDLIKPISESLSMASFDLDYSNYRRQNNKQYTPNGAIFIGYNDDYLRQKHFFGAESIAYIMSKEDSVDIDDRLDFDIAIMLMNKRVKDDLLLRSVYRRIHEKKESFKYCKPVTLIGHSIFDFWDVDLLANKKVNNLGIAGITSDQYYNLILKNGLIDTVGDIVFIMTGSNDIVIDGWSPHDTVHWINETIEYLLHLNQDVQIYVVSVPPVLGRIERDNNTIKKLNYILKANIVSQSNIKWLQLSEDFYDAYGNLNIEFTNDGLHFSNKAYECLENLILSCFE
ncbi:GDSL-type esterase/lipase family protein [Enterobacter hormaechei]|uniref:cytidylyltransferase domain-containing protein n=1 Tax=Enterobacter hormaechei TaxID=158836 RepID=UPI0007B34779|nr:GDSL-type esterase/lipase family protein [Enterobacter hormaechei]KZR06533.1 acylneuraminate cytidylyltransferase [Enterobacter hormaechei subsp. steigerwaltii]HCM9094005.1 acylneuraminate cytidylyltransferase [Enterobacter hormaechei subsp. steigerwaltii]HDC4379032.1 acylneuraminate cytidylyltransferase [Enterobacter hormaechei]